MEEKEESFDVCKILKSAAESRRGRSLFPMVPDFTPVTGHSREKMLNRQNAWRVICMYNPSSKSQVKYSLRKLSEGLFFHMEKKPFARITITEICEKARITRRTFYRNCDSKTDLILFSTDMLVYELLKKADFHLVDPYLSYVAFFRYWKEHRQFLTLIHKHALFDVFLNEFISVCNQKMRYPLQERSITIHDNSEQIKKYSNGFIVGGLGQMLRQWTEDGFAVPVDEIARSIVFLAPDSDAR